MITPHTYPPARTAFPSFAEVGDIEPHISLQLGAGIPALFEKLLDDTEINWLGRIKMMNVCMDWVKRHKSSLDNFFT